MSDIIIVREGRYAMPEICCCCLAHTPHTRDVRVLLEQFGNRATVLALKVPWCDTCRGTVGRRTGLAVLCGFLLAIAVVVAVGFATSWHELDPVYGPIYGGSAVLGALIGGLVGYQLFRITARANLAGHAPACHALLRQERAGTEARLEFHSDEFVARWRAHRR